MFQPLGELLKENMRQHHLNENVVAYEILELVKEEIKQQCGESVAEHVKPLHYKRGSVTIACLGASYAQEIRLNELNIIDKLNESLEKKYPKHSIINFFFIF